MRISAEADQRQLAAGAAVVPAGPLAGRTRDRASESVEWQAAAGSPDTDGGETQLMQGQSDVSEKQLLDAITTVLAHYINETDPFVLFNGLLEALLEITGSEYGFIGEVFYNANGQPYIKSYATTNIAWSEETRRLYEDTRQKGMAFSKIDSLYGAIIKTGQLVISNQPGTDPRAGGLPKGHPPLNAFMGLPFYTGSELLGVVGIANRKHGYQRTLAASLQPFLTVCSNLIQAYRNNVRHWQVEAELRKLKQQVRLEGNVALGAGYIFNASPIAVTHNGQPILLTKKELILLELLVINRNLPVQYSMIEERVWQGVVVGESSMRSLVRRLRKKLPGLEIKTTFGVSYMLVTGE